MQSEDEAVTVTEEMLKNYDREALAADIEHMTLKEKRGVKVKCGKTGRWVPGMIKTVDHSGVLVATVLENGTRSGEHLSWDLVESCLKALEFLLPANFDDRKWTNADELTPKAKAPVKRPAPKEKVKKPAAKRPAASVAASSGLQKKKKKDRAQGDAAPVLKDLQMAAVALGVAVVQVGRMSLEKLCKMIREKVNDVDGADDEDEE